MGEWRRNCKNWTPVEWLLFVVGCVVRGGVVMNWINTAVFLVLADLEPRGALNIDCDTGKKN